VARDSDPLIASACELCTALDKRSIRPIIAGGLGLYLRELFLNQERQARYPLRMESRTTRDIDVFLTVEMIVDLHVVEAVRDVLRELGYSPKPEAFYFQFVRTSTSDAEGEGAVRHVKVDLMAAVPDGESASLVTGTAPRIKPIGASEIHARRAPEAELIHVRPAEISVPASGRKPIRVLVPSSINYLILKLHALRDNVDLQPDFGRHHAWDIMTIVAGMVEEDWNTARFTRDAYAEAHCFQEAITISRDLFGNASSLGFIRLQENEAFRASRDELVSYIANIRDDLTELFGYSN